MAKRIGDLATNTATVEDVVQTGKKKRIQFEFSPEAFNRLEDVKRQVGASTYASLVRDALRVYEYLAKKQAEGYEVAFRKDGEPLTVVEFLSSSK